MQMSGHPADLPVSAALGLVYYRNALIFAEDLMDWGISNVEESAVGTGSLRRLMGEKQGISTTKKQNCPQIVK